MKPAQKTCSTPAHCIRESSFTQKTSSIFFSRRFFGGWNLLRTRHVNKIAICAVEEVNSFGFVALSFRSEMLISFHDIKTLSGFSISRQTNKEKNMMLFESPTLPTQKNYHPSLRTCPLSTNHANFRLERMV